MPRNVLIVDDHFETASILQEFLADNSIGADIATTGTKALACAQNNSYHCLVTDIMLPDLDGITVARQICTANRKTEVIFVTAKEIEINAINKKFGFNCKVLRKPCKLSEILRSVRKCL